MRAKREQWPACHAAWGIDTSASRQGNTTSTAALRLQQRSLALGDEAVRSEPPIARRRYRRLGGGWRSPLRAQLGTFSFHLVEQSRIDATQAGAFLVALGVPPRSLPCADAASSGQLAARGVQIVGVFQSPPEAVAEFVRERAVSFVIVTNEQLYQEWALEASLTALLGTHLLGTMTKDVVSGRAFTPVTTLYNSADPGRFIGFLHPRHTPRRQLASMMLFGGHDRAAWGSERARAAVGARITDRSGPGSLFEGGRSDKQ